jgi:hypothetical protein
MIEQSISREYIAPPSTDDQGGDHFHAGTAPAKPHVEGERAVPQAETDFKVLLQTLRQKKERGLPGWLQNAIGWAGFIVILMLFLGVQILLIKVLSGRLSDVVLGVSGILEIGSLWLWELYWY